MWTNKLRGQTFFHSLRNNHKLERLETTTNNDINPSRSLDQTDKEK